MRSNDNFRNDLLLSFLSNQEVQEHKDVFDKYYTEEFENHVFNLTNRDNVRVEDLIAGKSVLSFVSAEQQKIKM